MVIVLNIAGLSPALIEKREKLPSINSIANQGTYRKMAPTFPAVTCSVQASLLTGKPPTDHGIVANGFFNKERMQTEFWRQENALVRGPRIWDIMRERNAASKVAVMFWQNSKYIDADIVVTPAPLHTDKGMIEWCYSKPADFYETLSKEIGQFYLRDYWGPLAGEKSSRWIARASLLTLRTMQPDLLLAYIPHLDYVCQRAGPESAQTEKELIVIDNIVGELMNFREEYGKDKIVLFIVSEYGFTKVRQAVFPNVILREKGLLKVREINGQEYIDFEASSAFAVVDHQVAHIYCKRGAETAAQEALQKMDGVSKILDRQQQKDLEIHHARSGDLIALSRKDSWFSYYYWLDANKAPFYAQTVDIHNKPGYDPCELFIDPKTKAISLKPELINGSHGLPAEDNEQFAVMICSDADLDDYAPEPFSATQFLGMLYRVI